MSVHEETLFGYPVVTYEDIPADNFFFGGLGEYVVGSRERTTLVVAFLNGSPLLLEDYKLDDNGKVIAGWVVNGAWYLVVKDGEMFAWDSYQDVVTQQPQVSEEVVSIPDEVQGDYNEIIAWAQEHK